MNEETTATISKHDCVSQIQLALRTLFEDGQLIEVRAKRLEDRKCRSKFYTDHAQAAEAIDKANQSGKYEAIWYTLQRLNPKTVKSENESTSREDIRCYEWLVIDIDRPKKDPSKKLNATEGEIATLNVVALDIVAWLKDKGFPEPILACSGNGWHLLYKLPSLDTSFYPQLKAVLKAVAHQFADRTECCIDTSLAEPEQVIKSYGSMSRKTPKDSPELAIRPWRESYIESVPNKIEPVSMVEILAIGEEAPKEKTKVRKSQDGVLDPDFAPQHFFDWAAPYIVIKSDYMDGDVQRFVAETCCLDLEDPLRQHSNQTIYRYGDTFGIKCFADQCEGKTIGDVLRNLSLLKGEKYPRRIWLPDNDPTFGNFAEVVDDTEPEASESEAAAAEPSPDLEMPESCMRGKLGELARLMDVPLGFAYPALLAAYSVMSVLDEMLDSRINIYAALCGSTGSCKNLAIRRGIQILGLKSGYDWQRLDIGGDLQLTRSLGDHASGKRSDKTRTPGHRKFLLVNSEISDVLCKTAIEGSNLSGKLCDLWDENEYSKPDGRETVNVNCRLSWLGGLPATEEDPSRFTELFGVQTNHGLYQRFIFGYSGVKDWRWKAWKCPVEHREPTYSFEDDAELMAQVNNGGCVAVRSMTPEAEALMEAWSPTVGNNWDVGRLRYNLKKVAMLTASASGLDEVNEDYMKGAIEFMEWQVRFRTKFITSVAELGNREAMFADSKLIPALEEKGARESYVNWRRIALDRKWERKVDISIQLRTVEGLIRMGKLIPEPHEDDFEDNGKEKTIPVKELAMRKVKLGK